MIKAVKSIVSHPLFSGSFLMVSGSMLVNVVNYIYHLLMGRMLGPVDYGTLASVYSILYIVTIIPSSASVSIVKFISSAKSESEKNNIYFSINKFVFHLSLVLSITIALLSPLISRFLNISNSLIIFLVSPILFFSIITLVNMSTSQGALKFIGVVLPNFISGFSKLIFGMLFVFLGYSVVGAMWGVVIGAVIAYLLSQKMIRSVIKNNIKSGNYKLGTFFKYSWPVLLQALAFTSFFTTDIILVKHYLPAFEVGIYAALSTLGKVIFFAATPVTAAMFPIVASRYSKKQNYTNVLTLSLFLTTMISFGIAFIYLIFPEIAIEVLYGSKYLVASDNLFRMGLFLAFYSISYLLTSFYLSIEKTTMVYFPIVFAIFQIIAIYLWHSDISVVINISLVLMILLTLVLTSFLRYNLRNEKRQT